MVSQSGLHSAHKSLTLHSISPQDISSLTGSRSVADREEAASPVIKLELSGKLPESGGEALHSAILPVSHTELPFIVCQGEGVRDAEGPGGRQAIPQTKKVVPGLLSKLVYYFSICRILNDSGIAVTI